MEINDNPPCEHEWTIAEMEEFFASQDARTGLLAGATWSNASEPTGIHVTSIVPPARGWPIAMYCPICRETTFILSPWAAKPKDGDYFRMNEVCGSVEHGGQHNLRMTLKVDDHIIYKRLVK